MFTMIMYGLIAAVLIAAVSPPARRFFKNLIRAGGAQMNELAESVGAIDPLAQFKNEIENSAENAKNAQKIVTNAASNIISLERQVNADLKEQTRLTNRIKSVKASGDPNNSIRDYALQLAACETRLQENQSQLTTVTKDYKENLALVDKFEQKISTLRKEADKLGFELEKSESEKEMKIATSNLKQSLAGNDLSNTRERLQKKIDANRGISKALDDTSSNSIEELDDELEVQAKADEILARFN